MNDVLVEKIRATLLPDQHHPDDQAYYRLLIRAALVLADWHRAHE